MTKNKPPKPSSLFYQVVAIGCFLFCAALFGHQVFADQDANTHTWIGTLALTPECSLSTTYGSLSRQFGSYYANAYTKYDFNLNDLNISPDATILSGMINVSLVHIYDNPFLRSRALFYGGIIISNIVTNSSTYNLNQDGINLIMANKNLSDFWITIRTDYDFYSEAPVGSNYAWADTPETATLDVDLGALATSTSNINFGKAQCCTNSDCVLPISFDSTLDDDTIEWQADYLPCTGLGTLSSSATLNFFGQSPSQLDLGTLSLGNHSICVIDHTSNSATVQYVNIYSATSTICESLHFSPSVFCTDEWLHCGYYDTSTVAWSGLVCGLKQAGCFMVNPATSSLYFISSVASNLQTKAPFSLYFSITNTIKQGLEQTSTTSTSTLGVPMWNATSRQFYVLPVVTTSSLSNTIGITNANMFKNTITWIVWAMVAVVCLVITRI